MPVFSDVHINFLPKKARAKAIALDEARDAAAAAVKAANNDLEAGWARRDAIERDARNAGQRIRTGTVNLANYPTDKLRALISGATDEDLVTPLLAKAELDIAERLKPRLDRASEAFQAFAVVDATVQWLNEAMRAKARLEDAPAAKLKTSDFLKDVERVREEIAEIEERLAAVEYAPLPLADVRKSIVREIDAIAERGRPSISFTAREVSPIRLDRALGFVNSKAGPRIAETLVWAMRDVITEQALALAGTIEPENAMSDDERDAALGKLAADRLAAERLEETTITAAAAIGQVIPRRADADPRAVLEVVETSPAWRSRHDIGLDNALVMGG
ncbi:hypothetical protein PYH37_002824 [Sinorhizobium numidicum]|uniref:Uncharacterized protein n=1 Tax=Sinorhizobium numidicum TaxID=680248 RepID=A0ABY8D1A2_9HYPH|nr:hypothetical protein [Sinorhizobium numidicum]WEX77980.1 hypothetical protein PYH37_002824 [Sinorhizobium numidicum]WEX84639.1 hypothetical protein PYH38_003537 [Sinorhizobium numidicum]